MDARIANDKKRMSYWATGDGKLCGAAKMRGVERGVWDNWKKAGGDDVHVPREGSGPWKGMVWGIANLSWFWCLEVRKREVALLQGNETRTATRRRRRARLGTARYLYKMCLRCLLLLISLKWFFCCCFRRVYWSVGMIKVVRTNRGNKRKQSWYEYKTKNRFCLIVSWWRCWYRRN